MKLKNRIMKKKGTITIRTEKSLSKLLEHSRRISPKFNLTNSLIKLYN